jgi:hypothetical protein
MIRGGNCCWFAENWFSSSNLLVFVGFSQIGNRWSKVFSDIYLNLPAAFFSFTLILCLREGEFKQTPPGGGWELNESQ